MQSADTVRNSPVINTKNTVVLLFFSLVVIAMIMYRYSIMELGNGTDLRIYFGSADITIHLDRDLFKEEKSSKNKEILIVLWSKRYKNDISLNDKIDRSCKQNYRLSRDISEALNADALLIHIEEDGLLPGSYRNITWILHITGSPNEYTRLRDKAFMNQFQYSIGSSIQFDFYKPLSEHPVPNVVLNNSIYEEVFHGKSDHALAYFTSCNKTMVKFIQSTQSFYNITMINICPKISILRNRFGQINKTRLDQLINKTSNFKYYLVVTESCSDILDENMLAVLKTGGHIIYFGNQKSFGNIPRIWRKHVTNGNHFQTAQQLGEFMQQNKTQHNGSEVVSRENNNVDVWCNVSTTLMRERISHKEKSHILPIRC